MNIKSQATIYYAYDLDGISYKSTSTSNTLLTPLKVSSLYAKKIANASYFKPGDIITYTIVVNNGSSFKATNVKIKDKLDNQSFLNGSFKYYYLKDDGEDIRLTMDNQKLEFIVTEIAPYATVIIMYKAKVNDNLEIDKNLDNQSIISSDETKDFKTNDLSIKQKYAKVICEKSILNDYAYLNTNITYKITVKNIGNCEACDLEIVDELPETFKLSPSSPIVIGDQEITNYSYDSDKCILRIPLDYLEALSQIDIYINGSIVK